MAEAVAHEPMGIKLRGRRTAGPSGLGWFALRFHMTRLACGMPGYGATLSDADPGEPVHPPEPVWAGDPQRGAAIRDGVFPFAGRTVRRSTNPWGATDAGDAWLTALNGFGWLADLAAVEDHAARRRAIGLMMDWIDHNRNWSPHGWNAAVLGARVASWLTYYRTFLHDADELPRARVRKSLLRQASHLDRVAAHEVDGAGRLVALKGLVYASLCLAPRRKRLGRAVTLLSQELDRQVLPDGGHVERSPTVLVSVLRHAIELRAAFRTARVEVPDALQGVIDRMAPMLRFFRHEDGGLALFNDTAEGAPSELDLVLGLSEVSGKPPRRAPHSGFERLSAGRTLAIVDVGSLPPVGFDRHAHAGALSFEMSVAKERLFVNCGAAAVDDAAWREAQRSTAAHSTLSVSETNSSALEADGFGARRARATAERNESDGRVWLEASHDGYADLFGMIHRRRLYLAANGEDLRGEDILSPVRPNQPVTPRPVAVRFHLHPEVQVSLLANQAAALLRLPSGAGWRMRVSGAKLSLEESLYLGKGAKPRRSQQLVLAAETGAGDTVVKWGVQREARKS